MKQLHRDDMFNWSEFNEERNLDFHSVLWVQKTGNVLIDPLTMVSHDFRHLQYLGGAALIIVTNSDHCRAAEQIAQQTGALICGPAGERDEFPIACDRWITDNEVVLPGLTAYAMEGSKTPGELALLVEDTTLISGDLIRCHQGGQLCLLPAGKLTNPEKAKASVLRLAALPKIDAVLPGDGWPIFNHGDEALQLLARTL